MSSPDRAPGPAPAPAAPRPPERDAPAYEAPRILTRRSVERITLISQPPVGPGGGIGGE